MFETAVQEKHTGARWGLIGGLLTFAGLLAAWYVLVA